MPFDELLAEVDRLAGLDRLGDRVLCQSGQSAYRMRHAEQFAGRPNIDDLIAEAALVISHGGATVIQLLAAGKPFVAFANPRGAGDHQTSFLRTMSGVCDISWSGDVGDCEQLVAERRARGASVVPREFPRAADLVRGLLFGEAGKEALLF